MYHGRYVHRDSKNDKVNKRDLDHENQLKLHVICEENRIFVFKKAFIVFN